MSVQEQPAAPSAGGSRAPEPAAAGGGAGGTPLTGSTGVVGGAAAIVAGVKNSNRSKANGRAQHLNGSWWDKKELLPRHSH